MNAKPIEKRDQEIRKGQTVSKIASKFFIKSLNGIFI